MSTRDEARELLLKIRSCRPRSFFGKVDESQRGTGFVLNYLRESDHEVVAGELARELGVSTARIAALLKTMEKNGLILRQSSAEDARLTMVRITREGIEYNDRMWEFIVSKMELLIKKVGREELEEFIRISYKIREALGE